MLVESSQAYAKLRALRDEAAAGPGAPIIGRRICEPGAAPDWAGLLAIHPRRKITVVRSTEGRELSRRLPQGGLGLMTSFLDGATIVIDEIDRALPELYRWTAQLERALRCSVHANCYVSPRDSAGLRPHTDDYDILVVQVEGSKAWEFGERFAGPARRFETADFLAQARTQATLSPGDALFLPAGTAHRAFATASGSVHLTFGLHAFERKDLKAILNRALDDLPDAAIARLGGSGDDIAAQLDNLLASPDFSERLARAARGHWPSQRDIVSPQFNNLVGGRAPEPAGRSETPDADATVSPAPPYS